MEGYSVLVILHKRRFLSIILSADSTQEPAFREPGPAGVYRGVVADVVWW